MRQASPCLPIAYALSYLLIGAGSSLSWVVRPGDADREAVKGARPGSCGLGAHWRSATTLRRWHALNAAATVPDCDAQIRGHD